MKKILVLGVFLFSGAAFAGEFTSFGKIVFQSASSYVPANKVWTMSWTTNNFRGTYDDGYDNQVFFSVNGVLMEVYNSYLPNTHDQYNANLIKNDEPRERTFGPGDTIICEVFNSTSKSQTRNVIFFIKQSTTRRD